MVGITARIFLPIVQASTRRQLSLEEKGEVDDVAQVVVAVDGGISEQTVQVVFDAFDYDVWVHSKDRNKGRINVSEQHVYSV